MGMMRAARWSGAILLLSGWLIGAPASARAEDWAFTKWGMTEDEVAAASGGKATPCQDDDDCREMSSLVARAKLRMPLQSDGIDQIAFFQFDRKTERLTSVIIRPKDKFDNTRWAVAQRIKLKATYGPWKEVQWFGMPTWEWKWGDGQIQLFETTKYDMDIAEEAYVSKAALDAAAAQE